MPNSTLSKTYRMIQVSDDRLILLCGLDDPIPSCCPEMIPDGYTLLDDILDVDIKGEAYEAFICERKPSRV